MAADLPSHSAARHAAELLARASGGDWSALVVSEDDTAVVATETARQLELFGEEATRLFVGTFSPDQLLSSLSLEPAAFVVVSPQGWHEREWRQLDRTRSALPVNAALVFVLSVADFFSLSQCAPNVASLLGAQVHNVRPDEGLLTEMEKKARLEFLRETKGLTDDQVIQMAMDGTLPSEPEYGEWLLLMNRGDLL